MNCMVVMPSLRGNGDKDLFCMPLGLPYISAALKAKGHNVISVNMQYIKEPEEFLMKTIEKHKIEIVLCGGLTIEYPAIKKVFDVAKRIKNDIITIGGGGGFSSEPILFSEITGVDYAIIGEGEVTVCELVDAIENKNDINQVDGVVWKIGNSYVQNKDRDIEMNPDVFAFPDYEGFGVEEYLDNQKVDGWYHFYSYYSDNPRIMPMIMARSCPFQCGFCYHPLGNKYRYRSLDNFFKELELLIKKYNINGIALIDECFSIDKKRVEEFCERIKKYDIVWACQMRVETYFDELVKKMKEANCIGAYFGIESLSQSVLMNMNKRITKEQIDRAFDIAYKHKVGCSGSLIFGAEVETFDTVKESLRWCDLHKNKYKSTPIRQFGMIDTYPGSIYYNNAVNKKIIKDKKSYIKEGNFTLNITDLSDRQHEIIGMVAKMRQSEITNKGEVISIEYNDQTKKVDASFKCCHCGAVIKYKNLSPEILDKGYIRRLGCRNCNILCDYVIDSTLALPEEYLTILWLLGDYKVRFDKFTRDKKLKNIIVFGKNLCSKILLEQFERYVSVIQISSETEINNKKADVIIVSDPINFNREKTELIKRTQIPIWNIEEVLKYSKYEL